MPQVAAVSWRWCQDVLRSPVMWVMLVLPAGLSWTVLHAQPSGPQRLDGMWLVFAQVMTGLMFASSHWLEEREQGTWQRLRLSPVPVGWLLLAQCALAAVLTLGSELIVWGVNAAGTPLDGSLLAGMLAGAILATAIGTLIGVASPSARSGSMLGMVVMLVLFLATIAAPGLSGQPLLHALLGGLPSVLAARALASGPAPGLALAGMGLWLVAVVGTLAAVLRRQYGKGW